MASQICAGPMSSEMVSEQSDCHDAGAGDPATKNASSCPGDEVTPDLGKLPTVAPLPMGHDFATVSCLVGVAVGAVERDACLRARPDLDALCRLLI